MCFPQFSQTETRSADLRREQNDLTVPSGSPVISEISFLLIPLPRYTDMALLCSFVIVFPPVREVLSISTGQKTHGWSKKHKKKTRHGFLRL